MKVEPAILLSLSGPAATVDIAARSDRPLTDPAATVATTLGLGDHRWHAACHRVAASPRQIEPGATLAEAGVLDGDLIWLSPLPDPPEYVGPRSRPAPGRHP